MGLPNEENAPKYPLKEPKFAVPAPKRRLFEYLVVIAVTSVVGVKFWSDFLNDLKTKIESGEIPGNPMILSYRPHSAHYNLFLS